MADENWKITDWAGIVGIIMAIIAMLGGIRKVGAVEQAFRDGIEKLEEGRKEDRAAFEKIVSKIDDHFHETGIHINPEMERRAYTETMSWRDKVDARLERLIEQARENKK